MKKQILLIAFVCISILANAQWQLTGNSGTSFFNFLGTTDVAHLRFRTNNVQRMIITNQGKVGIGTSTPAFQFEVNGGSMSVDTMYRIEGNPAVFMQNSMSNYFLFRGSDSITTGNSNILVGPSAGPKLNTGSANSFIGLGAGFSCTSGTANVVLGQQSAIDLTTGNDNTCVGRFAGEFLRTGENNVFIGTLSQGNAATSNSIAIGYFADVANDNSVAIGANSVSTTNNKMRLGNSAITSVEGQVAYSFPSDGRFKSNINENVPGMNFINRLRPVTYNFEAKKFDEFLHQHDEKFDARLLNYDQAEKIIHSGFIAQEVEQAAHELKYDFDGVNAPSHDADNYSMSYELLVVPMVKGMQELWKQNEELMSEVRGQKSEIENLKSQVASHQSSMNNGMVRVGVNEETNEALLGQNLPNPFDNSTIIPFRIPKECHSATIIIAESTGKIVRAIPVSCKETQLSLEAGTLVHGVYSYSLMVDGVSVDTKQMILVK